MMLSNLYVRMIVGLLVALLVLSPAQARNHTVFEVKSVSTQLDESVYFLNAVFEINLPPYMVTALEQGFDLPLAMEVEVFEQNKYWFNKEIVMIKQKYLIQYHTLLDTVSVLNINSGGIHHFSTLKEALAGLSVLLNFPLLDNNALEKGEHYSGQLNFGIDETELPVPLKTQVLGQNNWDLVSDWFEWDINP